MPIIFRIFTMMPMMVLRSSKYVFQESKINAGIRMYQNCVDGYKNNVYVKNCGRKTQDVQRDEGHSSGKEYIHKMGAATCQPIHTFCRMMYGVKSP